MGCCVALWRALCRRWPLLLSIAGYNQLIESIERLATAMTVVNKLVCQDSFSPLNVLLRLHMQALSPEPVLHTHQAVNPYTA